MEGWRCDHADPAPVAEREPERPVQLQPTSKAQLSDKTIKKSMEDSSDKEFKDMNIISIVVLCKTGPVKQIQVHSPTRLHLWLER